MVRGHTCSLCALPMLQPAFLNVALQGVDSPGWKSLLGCGITAVVGWDTRGLLPTAPARTRLTDRCTPPIEYGFLRVRLPGTPTGGLYLLIPTPEKAAASRLPLMRHAANGARGMVLSKGAPFFTLMRGRLRNKVVPLASVCGGVRLCVLSRWRCCCRRCLFCFVEVVYAPALSDVLSVYRKKKFNAPER